jgi:HD-GYP domain-containing protein (c-di-GMP phosphodiesterase class II)
MSDHSGPSIMAIRRIHLADIALGEPLRWDLFSTPSAQRPLLRKGELIAPGRLESLLNNGLYAEAAMPTSVLRNLNTLNRRLELALSELRDQSSTDAELRAIAGDLLATVECHDDIALAAIFLNQISGAYAVRHCTETAIVVGLIGRAMNKPPSEVLVLTAAALTMNVGMIREGDIFQCKDGALSCEERAQIQRHPIDGVDLLRWAGITDEHWLDLVLSHHETNDGSGYPQGKVDSELSQNVKLIGMADRYCAFVSARNYRRSLLPPAALANLQAAHAMPFDAAVMVHFTEQIGPYPPGTLVRLENHELGVVSGRPDQAGAHTVHVLRSREGLNLPLAERRSTQEPDCAIAEALHEDSARLRFTMEHVWGEPASL